MVYTQPSICPGELDTQTPLGFLDTNESPNLGQMTRTCRIVDLAVLADHRVKLKENEKKDKYLELARELKNLWNIKVTVIPIVTSALDD